MIVLEQKYQYEEENEQVFGNIEDWWWADVRV
jgi:hypothetical protein